MILVLAIVLLSSPVWAMDYTVNLGLGGTYFPPSASDGTWWQKSFEHSFRTVDIGMKAGIGLRFNDRWSLDLNYVRLGTTKAQTYAVSDDDYNPNQHYCLRNCEHPYHLTAVDTWQGGEVLIKRSFMMGEFSPFLHLGAAVIYHDVRGTVDSQPECPSAWFQGVFPAAVMGGGVCYGWVCGEVNYYHGFVEKSERGGFPIATKAVAPMVSVRIPFSFLRGH